MGLQSVAVPEMRSRWERFWVCALRNDVDCERIAHESPSKKLEEIRLEYRFGRAKPLTRADGLNPGRVLGSAGVFDTSRRVHEVSLTAGPARGCAESGVFFQKSLDRGWARRRGLSSRVWRMEP